jgi:ureidoacrylate peracid hydrolase
LSTLREQEKSVARRPYEVFSPKTAWKIDPSDACFLSVDMQNSFVDEEGAIYLGPGGRQVIPNINRLAKECRQGGLPVIWVRTENTPYNAGLCWELVPIEGGRYTGHDEVNEDMLIWPGTRGAQFAPELDIQPGDIQAVKIRHSAFIPGSSNIPAILQSLRRKTVIMTGVASNVCVMASAMDAMMLDYRVIVVRDGSATISAAAHEQALDLLSSIFCQVMTTDEVLSKFKDRQKSESMMPTVTR